ncbi:MAG: S9 family peptidase [Bryobacteraceae bacterium]|nr:S9 family peptidase [Bryobacteraceae bacterium]
MRHALLALVSAGLWAGVPTIDDLLNLKRLGGVLISPNGRLAAYGVTEADWQQDAFVRHLWIADTATGKTWQLTRGKKGAGAAAWSPDSQWLAFTSDREGGKSQIFAIRPDGGEAVQLTQSDTGVSSFDWSPDGKTIAYTATDKRPEDRKNHLGDFEVVRRDYAFSHLWTFAVAEALKAPVAGKQLTKGREFTVGGFDWSPDGKQIAFSGTINPDLVQGGTADIYVLTLQGGTVSKIVGQPGPDTQPRWSPDGRRIVFGSAMGNPRYYHANRRLAVVSAEGGAVRSITDSLDESPQLLDWTQAGIFFLAAQKTEMHLFRADPDAAEVTRVSRTPSGWTVSVTPDGSRSAMLIDDAQQLAEVYVTGLPAWSPAKLTDMTAQVRDWTLPVSEVISWKSKDGTLIEGVLTKPAGFDGAKQLPLLCVIHGGPTGIDVPQKVHAGSYPIDLWTARGALVLRVNYRGSMGYGQKFRQLNVRNLGVGDAWDVESGVDHLIAKGWVNPQKVGVMGWSQGGYISAFLTAASTKFAAVSVGAGISNWATYYYNTDITPFTIQYLGDDPADDPEIYRKTSPMSYIKQAKTPTLIQHGENDRRVPIANGYELRQGLEDRGVPVEMIVYKGFGHGVTKPKARRAVLEHNLLWFNHYIWGDPKPDFVNPVLPKKEKEEKADPG